MKMLTCFVHFIVLHPLWSCGIIQFLALVVVALNGGIMTC